MTTQGDNQQMSDIPPFLVAILICDTAVAEPATGKKTLVGIFDRVNVAKFPTSRSVTVYFKLTDAEGNYKFRIDYAKVDSEAILAQAQTNRVLQIPDRLQAADFYVKFPKSLPIPEPGRYEFRVYANDMYIGRATFNAITRQ